MKRTLPILALLLLFCLQAFPQQTQPDTLDIFEEDLYYVPEDTILHDNEYIPEDIMFIPSDVLYNNSWNHEMIRHRTEDLSMMEDTVELLLINPSESPFFFPFKGRYTSYYGYRGRHFHAGVDISLNQGDTVRCAFDGKVRMARKYKGYGNMVVVRHFNGLETLYSHFFKILVEDNQDVKAGDPLGLGGHTGRATGNHLHFETRFLGEPFDPDVMLDFDHYSLGGDTLRLFGNHFVRSGKGKDTHSQGKTYTDRGKHSSRYYTVKKGDSLSKIAQRNKTTVSKLCKLNHISRNAKIRPGKKLKLR